jgi:HAD superfamily hydrolase (TIGR01549 family)
MIITFDFGQTLAELDHEFLAERLHERGARLETQQSRRAEQAAWRAYGIAKPRGHAEAWMSMMETLLREGGVDGAREHAAWLWEQQPDKNLWRRPIPGMFELATELRDLGVPVGILSNSEGKLAELVRELGKEELFRTVVDSGRVGLDKPDRRIFELAAARLGGTVEQLLHVGDSWEADVLGAIGAGARAIWFRHIDGRSLPDGVSACCDAAELRARLADLGVV